MSKRKIINFLLVGIWTVGLGLFFAGLLPTNSQQLNAVAQSTPSSNASGKTPIEFGKELYLENCASCHIPIPPEVLPTETWKELLERPQRHYGESLKPPIRLTTQLMWQYLSTFSRPLLREEIKPLYVEQSRYFRALHPKVDFSEPISHTSCLSCHQNAAQLDYQWIIDN